MTNLVNITDSLPKDNVSHQVSLVRSFIDQGSVTFSQLGPFVGLVESMTSATPLANLCFRRV